MRRCAGDDLEHSGALDVGKRGEDVPLRAAERFAHTRQPIAVHQRQSLERRVVAGAVDFSMGELDSLVKGSGVALHQEGVAQHRRQGRREGHGDAEVDAIPEQILEGLEEWDVGLGDGLVQPPLFEGILVLRMAHEGQVGVKHDGQITLRHENPRSSGSSGQLRDGRCPLLLFLAVGLVGEALGVVAGA